MCNGANAIGFRHAHEYKACQRTHEDVLALDNWTVAYSEQLLRSMVRTKEGWRFLVLSLGPGMRFLQGMTSSWQTLNLYANIFDSQFSKTGKSCCPNLHKAACRVSTGMADLVLSVYKYVEIEEVECENDEFEDFLVVCAKAGILFILDDGETRQHPLYAFLQH